MKKDKDVSVEFSAQEGRDNGKVRGGPKYPPICSLCGKELTRADMVGVGYDKHPGCPRATTVYRLQEGVDGYPEGWPLCAGGCGYPTMDGKVTCGDVVCMGRVRVV